MKLPANFYVNPTAEQIEEHIEFIDWSLMPLNLITNETKSRFSGIKMLNMITWLQGILSSCEVFEHKMPYINSTLLCRDEKCYVEISRSVDVGGIEIAGLSKVKIALANKEIFNEIKETFGIGLDLNTLGVVRNVIKWQFGLEEFIINVLDAERQKGIQRYFYNVT